MGRLGRVHYGPVGEIGPPALQRSFNLLAMKKDKFTGTRARARQNVILYWHKGILKTTMLETFREECATMVDGATVEDQPAEPTFVNLLNATVPAFQGSVIDGQPVLPLLHGVDLVVAGELTTMLGSDPQTVDAVTNFLNVALEEQRMTVYRLKFAHLSDKVKEFWKDHDVHYIAKKGSLSYSVHMACWAASRPLNKADEARLAISGFTDRFYMVRKHWVNMDEAEEQLSYRPRPQDYSRIKAWNDALWNSVWATLLPPPEKMVDRTMGKLKQLYRAYEKKNNLNPLSGHRSVRDTVNLYQLYASYAIVQTVNNDGPGPYEGVRYDLGVEELVDAMLPEYLLSRIPVGFE